MNKRIISFSLTVGSYWPEKSYPSEIIFPRGGESLFKTIEFETDGEHPYDDACDALKKKMGGASYHIWYWDWIEYHVEGVA